MIGIALRLAWRQARGGRRHLTAVFACVALGVGALVAVGTLGAGLQATLAREAGEEVPEGLTKAQASETIDRLQSVTGRGGRDQSSSPDQELPLDARGPTELGDADVS